MFPVNPYFTDKQLQPTLGPKNAKKLYVPPGPFFRLRLNAKLVRGKELFSKGIAFIFISFCILTWVTVEVHGWQVLTFEDRHS